MHLDHLPGSFFGPPNLVELLRHQAQHKARDRAFIYLRDGENDEIAVTYADVDAKARAIAAQLQEKDLAGERALLLYPAGLDFIYAFFGCLYAGVVAVTAYPPRRNRNMNRIEAIAADANARVALTIAESRERVAGFVRPNSVLDRMEWLATDTIADERAAQWREDRLSGDTLALLQYTSGSTGTPKGVMLAHANLMHNSAMISYAFEHTRSGSGVFWLPSYHDMGLIGGILQPMYVGQPNVIFSPAAFLQKPYRWLRAISHYGATISGGPNFAYDLAVDKITDEQLESLDLSGWTLAFNGAEPVRRETIDRFVERFAPCGFRREAFYPCYGLAEATLIVSGGLRKSPPVIISVEAESLESHDVVEALEDEAGTRDLVGSGGNLHDQQIRIVDPETRLAQPAGRVGEIWVSGPSVAKGYWNRPEESKATFQAYLDDTDEGPFLRTGDLGFMVDGELFVTGRLKDLIILRGVNYYPQDIEYTVGLSHPQIRLNYGAAFTVGDEDDPRLVIVQEVERRRDLDTEEILTAIRKAIAAEHELSVDAIILIKAGSIPKTSSGKIQRHACRADYQKGTLAEVGRWGAEPLLRADEAARGADAVAPAIARSETATTARTAQIVYQCVRKVAKERAGELDLETNIVELGLDSLERMEIVASLEETFGGRFPEEVLPEMETCGEVVEAVETYLGTEPIQRSARCDISNIPAENYDIAAFPEYQQLR
ncbi:MAG: AMP-binding protein, partial [Planctomycetales bacterium]|nr:AMP-binding protein [Planctomycetales bacterium]